MEEGEHLQSEAQIEQLVILFVLASMLTYVAYNCVNFATGGYRLVREEEAEEATEHND